MGFERPGEEGCVDPMNLKARDKLRIIGAAPGMRKELKKRRSQSTSEEEEFDEEDNSLRKRRKLRKKRRDFFKTVSDAESDMEGGSKSGAASSTDATSGDESGLSEDGYITDTSTVYTLMRRFHDPSPSTEKLSGYEQMRVSRMKRMLPTKLSMVQLAGLLTLALVARPGLTVTVEDVVRWLNSETLAWYTAFTALPQHYKANSKQEFQGHKTFTFDLLSSVTWRIASFLPSAKTTRVKSPEKIIILMNHPTNKEERWGDGKSSFEIILERIVVDLSLPTFLVRDILRTMQPLNLVTLTSTVTAYSPDQRDWWSAQLPSVMRRLLSLVLLALKFHCALDDQYEHYHSHNLQLLAARTEDNKNHFDVLRWIYLSKLRLDQLMASNLYIREQFQRMNHIGVPDLVPSQDEEKLKFVCPRKDGTREKRFDDIIQMLEGLKVNQDENDTGETANDSLQPLLDNTKLLVENDRKSPKLVTGLKSLLAMTGNSLDLLIVESRELEKVFKAASISKKKVANKQNYAVTFNGNEKRKTDRTVNVEDYVEDIFKGEWKRSDKTSIVIKDKELFHHLQKKYWFSSPKIRAWNMHAWSKGVNKVKAKRDLHNKHILTQLPDNFAWVLQYFSCYANIEAVSLLGELADIENMILHLDQDYFGFFKAVKTGMPRS